MPTLRPRCSHTRYAIISTPYDTYPAACLISQSVPIGFYMLRHDLLTFTLSDPVEDVKEVMGKVRFVYFPILDSEGNMWALSPAGTC